MPTTIGSSLFVLKSRSEKAVAINSRFSANKVKHTFEAFMPKDIIRWWM